MPASPSPVAGVGEVIAAGLDVVSGVTSYLAAQESASVQQGRAGMMIAEANANAQRYALQAQQYQAEQSVMYLASGVKLSGSPLDVLDTERQLAQQNIDAIQRRGAMEASDESMLAADTKMKGDAALMGGITSAIGMGAMSAGNLTGPSTPTGMSNSEGMNSTG